MTHISILIATWSVLFTPSFAQKNERPAPSNVPLARDMKPPGPKSEAGAADYWGQWRGPLGTGVSPRGNPPIQWSESKNVRWKTSIPGLGHSSPIVWGEHVFITTAVPYGDSSPPTHTHHADGAHDNMEPMKRQRFMVMAFNRRDGSIAWQRTLRDERPHEAPTGRRRLR